jgi:CheY-like chemotaxis protein
VILDGRAAGGDDWTLLERLRAGRRMRRLRIVALSGADGRQAERALALGADEVIPAPIEPGAVLEVTRRVLAGSRRSVHPGDWSKWMAGGRAT